MHPDAGGRRVGNAHLADAQHTAALADAVIDQIDAHLYGAVELFFAHGRLVEEVLRATGNLAVDDAFHTA